MTGAQEQERGNFATSDLALASLLHAEEFGCSAEARGREVWFIFPWTTELDNFVELYHEGEARTEPLKFIKAQRQCRKMIDAALGRNGRP